MLTPDEFEELTNRPESSTLDFKATQYDFDADSDGKKIAAFVKDVISFCNTVRNETSYIITGIKEAADHSKQFHGITILLDDAIFQNKVKDKVHPRPCFHYYTMANKNLQFGVFEFPVTKYTAPITPVVRMKGLEPGKVYYRQGTANTEALAAEVIRIHTWLQSLPGVEQTTASLIDETSALMNALTNTALPLSSVIADIYRLARRHQVEELLRFSAAELAGVEPGAIESDEFTHRVRKILITPLQFELNPYSTQPYSVIKNEFRKTEGVYEYRMLFSQSISQLETIYSGMQDKPNHTIVSFTLSARNVFPVFEGNDYPVYAYIFPDDLNRLFTDIRQRAIDLLMKL